MDGQAERRKQVATGRDTPAMEPGHPHARLPPRTLHATVV